MTAARVFVDTNVLIYAHDADAGPKQPIARAALLDLWERRQGMVSSQVLQEFYVNVTRKIASPLPRELARRIVRTYAPWHVELDGPALVLRASELEERHRLAFWDALIVAAALEGGATTLLSEDLNPGQRIERLTIDNPFAPSS
jgi:predicted nucleic acid-binding protein